MAVAENRRIVIAELPKDRLGPETFRLESGPVPEPGAGEVLVRAIYLSLDAANRAWMQGATYRDAIGAGDTMAGFVIGEVVASQAEGLAEGDIVEGDLGWQEYACVPAKAVAKIGTEHPLTWQMSGLGITGKTAYFGLTEIGRPREGETLLVSAAAGAVGSVVGQLGKILGMRVVGVAGADEKCAWLKHELGFDEAVNYKTGNLHKSVKEACPDGVDVYFDNTGGDILEAALFRMNQRGRIVCCGAVSQYDTGSPAPGPRGVPGLIVTKRLRMEGFIVMDYFDRRAEAEDRLAGWIADGQLKNEHEVIEGLENAPAALIGLLHGENRGKRMVRVGPEPGE
jgi:NADPH-dependent curcumin reductase CurA